LTGIAFTHLVIRLEFPCRFSGLAASRGLDKRLNRQCKAISHCDKEHRRCVTHKFFHCGFHLNTINQFVGEATKYDINKSRILAIMTMMRYICLM